LAEIATPRFRDHCQEYRVVVGERIELSIRLRLNHRRNINSGGSLLKAVVKFLRFSKFLATPTMAALGTKRKFLAALGLVRN